MMKKRYSWIVTVVSLLVAWSAQAQYGKVDHWETAVLETDEWAYFEGTTAPPTDWNEESYDDSSWKRGKGSFGYGDGDDSTVVAQANSLYLRIKFNASDTSKFSGAVISADFDDAFVAYINGVEVARENIGTAWTEPAYNELADYNREAELYQGGKRVDYLIKKFQLAYSLKNGNNVLAIQVHNSTNFSSDMSAFFNFTLGVNDASQHYRTPPSWFVEPPMYADASTLPIIRLTSPKLNDSIKIAGKMEITWNGAGQMNPFDQAPNHYNGNIEIKYRGNSTLEFPKKAFRIETHDSTGASENVSLFGFPKENDWVLYAPYSDKSLLRNYVTYNLGRSLGAYAPRTQLVEVFHNGYYMGVYVFTEKLKRDKNRIAVKKLDSTENILPEVSGGYVLRIDWAEGLTDKDSFELQHPNGISGYSDLSYQYYYPKSRDITDQQRTYIRNYMWELESAMLASSFADENIGWPKYIDIASAAEYFLITEFSKDIDAYRYSVYMYKHHDDDGGKLHLGPIWDYNLGYGNVDFGSEEAEETDDWLYDKQGRRMFWYFRLLQDPNFAKHLSCEWQKYRLNAFATDSMNKMIDDAVAEMGEAATRNHYHWNTLGRYVWPNNFVGDTYQEELDYLKNWLKGRAEWMDVHVPGNCVLLVSTEDLEVADSQELKVYPNPTTGLVNVKYGGLIEQVELVDISGKVLRQIAGGQASYLQFETGDLPTGIYLLQLTDHTGHREVRKLSVR